MGEKESEAVEYKDKDNWNNWRKKENIVEDNMEIEETSYETYEKGWISYQFQGSKNIQLKNPLNLETFVSFLQYIQCVLCVYSV